mmetsp:Transcript_24041/g.39510  ORF Transcript_24041/g.39510 Transcript_24041/m.39510 type:complete len:208 (+) Transcript_24041:822-1445(+)
MCGAPLPSSLVSSDDSGTDDSVAMPLSGIGARSLANPAVFRQGCTVGLTALGPEMSRGGWKAALLVSLNTVMVSDRVGMRGMSVERLSVLPLREGGSTAVLKVTMGGPKPRGRLLLGFRGALLCMGTAINGAPGGPRAAIGPFRDDRTCATSEGRGASSVFILLPGGLKASLPTLLICMAPADTVGFKAPVLLLKGGPVLPILDCGT